MDARKFYQILFSFISFTFNLTTEQLADITIPTHKLMVAQAIMQLMSVIWEMSLLTQVEKFRLLTTTETFHFTECAVLSVAPLLFTPEKMILAKVEQQTHLLLEILVHVLLAVSLESNK